MLTLAIFGKNILEKDRDFYISFLQKCCKKNIKLLIYKELYNLTSDYYTGIKEKIDIFSTTLDLANADILISLGGDGVLLDAIPLVRNTKIPILGINLGRLGFLTGAKKEEIDEVIDVLINKDYELDQRIVLQCLNIQDQNIKHFALNDIVIFKKDAFSLLTIHVEVNEKKLNSYYGDGLIFASPTGSTAYSLSCGGPILLPEADSILITPIASHTLTVRPLVVPGGVKIKVRTGAPHHAFNFSADSKIFSEEGEHVFEISKADFTIHTIRLSKRHFFDNIREKLFWGSDLRQ